MKQFSNILCYLPAILLLVHACATSEPVTEAPNETEDLAADQPESIIQLSEEMIDAYLSELELDELSEEELFYYRTRSNLGEQFSRIEHDMPELLLQEIEEVEVDIYQGFRIQILSTLDVSEADTTLFEFEVWADSTLADYNPRGYVHFRQPYYRVRVGDFHNRERANELASLLKVRYPNAWVVHDRVNPERVPADTLEFQFIDLLDRIHP